ncbi:MAG: hypothetical protein N2110_02395 [Flavobacteriales bacterium]|nr:hypothetical protein [Flavobacteriales bacterium]
MAAALEAAAKDCRSVRGTRISSAPAGRRQPPVERRAAHRPPARRGPAPKKNPPESPGAKRSDDFKSWTFNGL